MTEDELPPGARRPMTPEERRQRAKLAANARWAKPNAREEQSKAATEALWRRYEKEVDPDGVLSEADSRLLAVNAAKAQSARMNLRRSRPSGE